MSAQLKRLMMNARLMAEHDDQGSSGGGQDGEDFVVEIEGEEAEEQQQAAEKPPVDNAQQQDDQNPNKTEGEDDDEDEEGHVEGETEEQKLERRREERKKRKLRAKEKEESTKRELAAERTARRELEQRLAVIEGRDRSREVAQVDEGISRAGRSYEHWKAKLAEAMEQHDGAAATMATEKMMEAREADRSLKQMKTAIEKSQTSPRPAANVAVVTQAQQFMAENPWYKHGNPEDTDSRIVFTLDNDLAREGWNPETPEYWQELRARVKKYLPHRVAGGKVSNVDPKPSNKQTKSVVGGGGGESSAPGKQVFKLSAQRVQALKEAGMWEDPKKRQEAIKRFRDYDKQQSKKG